MLSIQIWATCFVIFLALTLIMCALDSILDDDGMVVPIIGLLSYVGTFVSAIGLILSFIWIV